MMPVMQLSFQRISPCEQIMFKLILEQITEILYKTLGMLNMMKSECLRTGIQT